MLQFAVIMQHIIRLPKISSQCVPVERANNAARKVSCVSYGLFRVVSIVMIKDVACVYKYISDIFGDKYPQFFFSIFEPRSGLEGDHENDRLLKCGDM